MVAKLDYLDSNLDLNNNNSKSSEYHLILSDLGDELLHEYGNQTFDEFFEYEGAEQFLKNLDFVDEIFDKLDDDEYAEAYNLLEKTETFEDRKIIEY